MGLWNRILIVLGLASVEAQALALPGVVRSGASPVECSSGYDHSSQLDDARLLASFALGFFVMHSARKRWHPARCAPDPDGFGNFDFLEDDAPSCQMEVLKLGF